MQQKDAVERRPSKSLYDQLYTNHLDCADHLCNEEASSVSETSSIEELYDLAYRIEADDGEGGAPPGESERRAPSSERAAAEHAITFTRVTTPLDHGSFAEGGREFAHYSQFDGEEDLEEEEGNLSDPFADYSNDRLAHKKSRHRWKGGRFNLFRSGRKAVKDANAQQRDSSPDGDSEGDELGNLWENFTHAAGTWNTSEKVISGAVCGRDSTNIALHKRGFYTLFLKSARAGEPRKKELCGFKVKFQYKVYDCKRKKTRLKPSAASEDAAGGDATFIVHDTFGEDSLSFASAGAVNVRARSTKILLLYAAEESVVEFSIVYNVLDSSPGVLYKLAYSGWCSTVPLSIGPHLRLRILSIDNCDNLGTTALAALYALEQRLSATTGANAKLADYFDVVCGTGTGAILAMCLLKGYSMKELRVQWQSMLSGLFRWSHSLAYGLMFDHAHVSKFMRYWIEILGTDFMCAKARPLCAVTSTNVKASTHDLFVFRNYANFHSPYRGTALAPMWLAAWAANALPTYMKGPSDSYLRGIGCRVDRESHFVDGRLLCTNPSLVALQETCELYGFSMRSLIDDHVELFLSVGTSKKDSASSKYSEVPAWQILLNSKTTGATHIEHSHAQQLFAEHPQRYQRIEIPRVHGCKYGKTDKAAVDEAFNFALDLIRADKAGRVDTIAGIINI